MNRIQRLFLVGLMVSLGSLLLGCNREPFTHVKVKGKVTYEDGSLIPAQRMSILFESLTPPKDAHTFPRPGTATVNVADGTFQSVTTRNPEDGLVAGKHKVLIRAYDETGGQSTAIPADYIDRGTTPLEIDTAVSTVLELKVKKPQ